MLNHRLTVTSFDTDGSELIAYCQGDIEVRLDLNFDLVDDLQIAVEEFQADMTPFINESMTIQEVADLYHDSPEAIIDVIATYAYRHR